MINKKETKKMAQKDKTPVKVAQKVNAKDDKNKQLAEEVKKKMLEKAEDGCPFC